MSLGANFFKTGFLLCRRQNSREPGHFSKLKRKPAPMETPAALPLPPVFQESSMLSLTQLKQLADPVVFHLSSPIRYEGNTYNTLTFRRPVGPVEIIIAEAIPDPVKKMNAVYASLASVPADVIALMSIDDQARLAVEVRPILALPPAVQAVGSTEWQN
jgi:hypothetical protein